MSVLVQVVVGQLQLVEGYGLFHPVRTRGRGIRVDVEPAWHVRFSFAGDYPVRVVVFVAAVVDGYDIHQQDVLGVRVKTIERHFDGWEHSPENKHVV